MLDFRLPACAAALLALTACSDPLQDVARLSDVDIPEGQPSAAAMTTETETGEENLVLPSLVEEATGTPQGTGRGGLFGLFRPRNAAAVASNPPEDFAVAQGPIATEAAVSTETVLEVTEAVAPAEAAVAERPRGLFGGLFQPVAGQSTRATSNEPSVEAGTVLPFGELARVCNAPRNLGQEIASHPERRPMFRIYDSNAGTTAPRPHYITGFSDGCARIFTASVVTLGSVSSHEFLRYQALSGRAYTATDDAYERVKRQVCRASRGQPCGSQIDALDRSTVFVSAYSTFGGGSAPATFLLHERDVAASAAP